MRSNEDDSGDETVLLSEKSLMFKGGLKSTTTMKWWITWIACILCFALGLGVGDLLNKRPRTSVDAHDDALTPLFALDLPVVFRSNEMSENAMPGPEADAIWEKLMPLGRGFVQIDGRGKPIRHDGSPSDLSQTKVVSVFHQMHCLNILRKSLLASIDNAPEFQYMVPQLKHHWKHCFDYLRQSLMCSADVTLEKLEDTGPRLLASVDGWGTEHMCRDWGRLFEWAEEHRATDDGGID